MNTLDTSRSFHLSLHGAKVRHPATRHQPWAGRDLPVVDRSAIGPLPVDFDTVLSRLATQADLFIEPDGSFVWRTGHGQIDGQLMDGRGGLEHVELKGICARESWEWLIAQLGWPQHTLLVHLVEVGWLLPCDAFAELWWPS